MVWTGEEIGPWKGGREGVDRETVEVTGWIQTCKGEER